jgi:hypothetical protein
VVTINAIIVIVGTKKEALKASFLVSTITVIAWVMTT